jgi:NADH-quinone oxidoreductase subunit H
MAGWSSANKYSLMGGLRAAAQLIAYELPLVLAAVGVAIQAGTLSLGGIVAAQGHSGLYTIPGTEIGIPFILAGQVVGFAIFMTASLAELSRTPFDMPIAESELVMGYLTEYSGLRFTMFFLGEYAGMVSLSAIASTLFLGGYYFPGLSGDALEILGPAILAGKVGLLIFVMIWLRWTFPRLREDQLQSLAWRWLIPASLANIMVTATLKVAF